MAIQEQQSLYFTPMTLGHIPHVLHIERDAYPEPWTFNMLRKELENECSYFCLMYEDNMLAGYGGYWLILDEAHVTRVTVTPVRRGKGLSKMLMHHIMRRAENAGARCLRLEVRESNIAAIRLYETLGFLTEGRRIGYYQRSNENALVMSKEIKRYA